MTAYLSFEWLKLSKRWMPRIIIGLLICLTALAFWGTGTRSSDRADLFLPRGWLAALTYCSFFAPFFWPVLGGTWAGNEYGWGTIRAALTRRPNRIEHVFAALAILFVGLAISILAILLAGTVGGLVVSGLTGNATWVGGVWSASFFGMLAKGTLTAWYVSAFFLLVAYAAADYLPIGRRGYRGRNRRHAGAGRAVPDLRRSRGFLEGRRTSLPFELREQHDHARGGRWPDSREQSGIDRRERSQCRPVTCRPGNLQRHLSGHDSVRRTRS